MHNWRKPTSLAVIAQLAAMFLLSILVTVGAFAQTTSAGTVIGTVTDQSGAVVPDAQVALTDLSTNTTLKATTNSSGHYAFPNVAPGSYTLKITKQGFQTALVQNQSVQVGQSLTEDVKLTIGAVS
ncbi:MAG: carboxypeptidase regulatory-like domain-containing protein, partial [Acidobacteria bacterium]|nr:carboxypeptidase regulatory-like domain-containing protein [Acidobacteriota bacterium]